VFSAPAKELRFHPRVNTANFRALFSSGTAWGGYSQKMDDKSTRAEIAVEGGRLELAVLRVPFPGESGRLVKPARATVKIAAREAAVTFRAPMTLSNGDQLVVEVTA
jgi:non-lysosomal glucosylceramidase